MGCHHLDPLLAEKEIKTAKQVYGVLAKCEDPVVRHLGFFMITQARQQGAFQFALGLCIFSNIILIKFGGAKPGEVADAEKPSDMVTLRNSKEFQGASKCTGEFWL